VTEPDVRIDAPALTAYLTALLGRTGMSDDGAAFMAGCLVQSSLWGKDSHGVLRAPHYVERLLSGALNPRPAIETASGVGGLEVLDGDNGPGFLVARAAMLRAVALAQSNGVGAVGARRSSHFGAAAIYARLASDAGMVGIAMTNSAAKIVAPGGARPITGSNPIAIAVPSRDEHPFVLDISMAALGGGTLLLAAERGEKIDAGLATDKSGHPTEDPAAAFAGFWLPMAGIKGLGLSYAVDLLSGVLTGAAFGLGMKSQYAQAGSPSGTGHFMIALNVDAIMDREEFHERVADFFSGIKSSPMQDSEAEMLVPGERAHRTAEDRMATGLPVSAGLYAQLLTLGEKLDVPTQALRARSK
jgi:L-2-hydroxycarboxylate dehydrogenase (NAD+)